MAQIDSTAESKLHNCKLQTTCAQELRRSVGHSRMRCGGTPLALAWVVIEAGTRHAKSNVRSFATLRRWIMTDDLDMQSDERARSEAEARAMAKLAVYRHLVTYVIVIGCLAAINVWTGPGYLWFLWPATGWGIGLLAHMVNVFVFSDTMLRRMTERELRHEPPHSSPRQRSV